MAVPPGSGNMNKCPSAILAGCRISNRDVFATITVTLQDAHFSFLNNCSIMPRFYHA